LNYRAILNASSIASAAFIPSAAAVTARSAPLTPSPPAYILAFDVLFYHLSTYFRVLIGFFRGDYLDKI